MLSIRFKVPCCALEASALIIAWHWATGLIPHHRHVVGYVLTREREVGMTVRFFFLNPTVRSRMNCLLWSLTIITGTPL